MVLIGVEAVEMPALGIILGVAGGEKFSWLAGLEGNVKSVEREGEAEAVGFDVGFFACPAIEESLGLEVGGDGGPDFVFAGGEEALGDAGGIIERSDLFDVDAEGVAEGEGVGKPVAGVGEIELEGIVLRMG